MQICKYKMAYENGFRCKSACQFVVKLIADCSTRVEDFSCLLYFQQNGNKEDFIYVHPGILLLPLQVRRIETAGRSSRHWSQLHILPRELWYSVQ